MLGIFSATVDFIINRSMLQKPTFYYEQHLIKCNGRPIYSFEIGVRCKIICGLGSRPEKIAAKWETATWETATWETATWETAKWDARHGGAGRR
jgi:hypothetical protein